jgi:hypothetical protein
MKSQSKIVATVVAAAIAASTISLPAFADTKKPTGAAMVPALGTPAILGATIPAVNKIPYVLVQDFKFKIWQGWGWDKIRYLKHLGYHVEKDIFYKKFVKVHAVKKGNIQRTNSSQGYAVVGCIMGSALGAISASVRKGTAMGNPLRWRSQAEHEAIVRSGAEKKYELTSDEAATALALCGLGSFALRWDAAPAAAPAVVKAKY